MLLAARSLPERVVRVLPQGGVDVGAPGHDWGLRERATVTQSGGIVGEEAPAPVRKVFAIKAAFQLVVRPLRSGPRIPGQMIPVCGVKLSLCRQGWEVIRAVPTGSGGPGEPHCRKSRVSERLEEGETFQRTRSPDAARRAEQGSPAWVP